MQKSVSVKKQHRSFVVDTFPGKNGSDKHTQVVADLPTVEKLIRLHMDQILANDMDGVTNSYQPQKLK